ncbi:MAG: hypothetical protein OEY14_02070 [Myxococcales bacterium]|nr:hypothetical protein [Myxococcales bacterium]
MRSGIIAFIIVGLGLVGCPPGTGLPSGGGVPGGGGGSGGELSSECQGDFGAGEAAMKLEGFLVATARFAHAAADLEESLKASCVTIGRELGMSGGELSGSQAAVCGAVSNKLRDEITSLRAEAAVRIDIVAQPPRCEIRVDAYASCAAECDVNVEPGELSIECEGGEISGQCSAECSGQCNVEVSGRCEGSCEGSCSGGCSGTCTGSCEGTCSATGADGQCNGSCTGTCHGTCSAGCSGSCEGECWVSGQASCSGECRGGCSVEYTEPRCSGTVRPPEVSADCRASCDARMQAEAECEPGQVEVVISAGGDVDEAKLNRIRSALSTGYAQLLAVGEKLRRLQSTGQALRQAGSNLGGVGSLGLRAGACVTEAVSLLPSAMASMTASVQVQVSFSASVSASAG